jgi:hypothetical protein
MFFRRGAESLVAVARSRAIPSTLSSQGSTRKKLAAASGCILEYIGDVAVMAGNRDERRRCWDYLNWLLKQRKGALSVDPKGRDDVLELPVPSGKAGRLSGKGGNVLRSIEKETSTFCFLTDHRAAADGESRDELMLIFGQDKRDRYKAMDLMEDAMEGKYQPKGGGGGDRGGRGGGGGDRGGRGGGGGNRRSDACHDFSVGKCTRGDKCRFSHDVGGGGSRGGRSDRDASPRRDGRGGPDRGRGRRDRDRDRDRRGPYGDGRGGGSRGGERAGRAEEAGARPGEDPRYDRR